jgi:hypothetical protein
VGSLDRSVQLFLGVLRAEQTKVELTQTLPMIDRALLRTSPAFLNSAGSAMMQVVRSPWRQKVGTAASCPIVELRAAGLDDVVAGAQRLGLDCNG